MKKLFLIHPNRVANERRNRILLHEKCMLKEKKHWEYDITNVL